ncbi:galactose oxidase early set domain-containing protein [Kamptonema sp. UHCC 0994]|uniref:galactose oxidase early set domain-containing protein n=1 Tax=Kamptonema sp. UHCC 0994 TaxID=3031329 RepID=UPI0023BA7619|nr:galactose oxidase early set domain-containing protein [Kamptonema sp. UHCC 0994]MDF0556157.1 galactose oxidase early set domain-containing protein [Kamptonema sp. UHCC 0994]
MMIPHNSIHKILRVSIAFMLAIAVMFSSWERAIAANLPEPPLRAVEGSTEKKGAWYTPPMPKNINERMQGLHASLLPNGKVLIVNGGSVRLSLVSEGIKGKDARKPWLMDNTALFDPSLSDPDPILDDRGNPINRIDYDATPFTKIKSPPTPVKYKGSNEEQINDPFCGGNVHLPNGDVLLVSGSWFPFPAPTPLGTKQTNRYDWKKNKWELAGEMADGHWYPGLLPLANGKIAIFSGVGFNSVLPGNDWGENLKVSTILEVFDPTKPPKNAWQSIDLKNLPNSPYKTLQEDGRSDFIALYPHTYPTKDGRFLITGDSGGTRELPYRKTHNTYFLSIADSKDGLSVKFEPGPKREGWSKYYTTSLPDPNSPDGDILLIGGMEGMNNPNLGPDLPVEGARTSADLERWHVTTCDRSSDPNCSPSKVQGEWKLKENFLGSSPHDRRTTHNAVILPTKQVLVVGGGNYVFYMPVYHPILMTPDRKADQGYRTEWMNPGTEPRLYHNNAILLPDARVLVMGGQGGYAAWDNRNGAINPPVDAIRQVRLDIKAGTADLAEKGQNFFSAETWQPEIFNPPYLFIDGPRPEITKAIEKITYGSQQKIAVSNPTEKASLVLIKLGSVTHGLNFGQRLVDLQFKQSTIGEVNGKSFSFASFTAPTDKHMTPPGYYMMFYVNDLGKPSHAKMVQLSL